MINIPSFKNLKDLIFSLIFTNRCRFCGDVCDIRKELCEKCDETLPVITGEICYFCGVEKKKCVCREKSMFYLSVCSPYYYKDGPKKATVLLKYSPNEQTIERLGNDMAKCVEYRYKDIDFDAITYVPQYIDDETKRGFNQSKLLAEAMGEKLNIPVVELLHKTYPTEPQHTLTEIERSGNLLGAFEVNSDYEDSIFDARILLCDDIKTTGSTLNECAKTLLIGGCAEVRCITACLSENKK